MNMNKAQMEALMSHVLSFVNTLDAAPVKEKKTRIPARKPVKGYVETVAIVKAKKAAVKPVKAPVKVEPGIHTTESFKAGTASLECFAGLSKKGRKYAGIRVADGYGRGMLLNVKEFIALVTILRTDTAKDVKAFLELHSA